MASFKPVRASSASADRGEVRVGASADLTIFELDEETGEFRLEATVVAGCLVSRRGDDVPIVEQSPLFQLWLGNRRREDFVDGRAR